MLEPERVSKGVLQCLSDASRQGAAIAIMPLVGASEPLECRREGDNCWRESKTRRMQRSLAGILSALVKFGDTLKDVPIATDLEVAVVVYSGDVAHFMRPGMQCGDDKARVFSCSDLRAALKTTFENGLKTWQ